MNLSLRWKVALGTLAAVLVGLLVAGWLVIRSVEQTELSRMAEMLETRSSLAAMALRPLFDQTGQAVPSPLLHTTIRELSQQARLRITVIKQDGTVLSDSAVPAEGLTHIDNHLARPEVAQALASGRGMDIRASQTTGERTYYVARLLSEPARIQPGVPVIRLGLPLTSIDERVRHIQQDLLTAFGAAFLLAMVLSLWVSRNLTKPLSEMAAAARQLAAGTPGIRLTVSSSDEVGLLARTLNQMTDQLETKIKEVSDDRAQLLAMLIAMVEGVMVLDYRGTVVQVNPALERMFALELTESRGRHYAELIRHEGLTALVSAVLQTRSGQGGEITLSPSGSCLRVEASIAGGNREQEACAVFVFHDITELRRLEKIRKDFVANVSHELRTPLTSIKGYVEALLDGGKDDPSTAAAFLEIIMRQSNRLNLILDDLLQLSQIESGQVLFRREPVELRALLERTVAVIKPLADKKHHTIELSLPDEYVVVEGDEERLVQVFINLLENAVKYTPDQGRISMAIRQATQSRTASPRPMIEIVVADSGIGIPEADRPRVFERFYRVDKARSRELGGTGLGLAIVKHIVEAHSGHVWVEGNAPRGSRFVVHLPVAQESSTTISTAAGNI
ncbi:MAG TPA: ATP-binding protein [Nitrospira sp.]|nr:HAMP domain-containing protein [Nitrospira sp.]MBX7038249.1 HAMP domain-containing protein [Nitrospira sp.]HMU28722.1 ATP-binding protein [Nitrospira sp.]HMV55636.1 ATP-binding protein [Nitrospira sp.]HMW84390.1 ATP-binding protein [Nitrospira sp.]